MKAWYVVYVLVILPGCASRELLEKLSALSATVERAQSGDAEALERLRIEGEAAKVRLGRLFDETSDIAKKIESNEPLELPDIGRIVSEAAKEAAGAAAVQAGRSAATEALSSAEKFLDGKADVSLLSNPLIRAVRDGAAEGQQTWELLIYALAAYLAGSVLKGGFRKLIQKKEP